MKTNGKQKCRYSNLTSRSEVGRDLTWHLLFQAKISLMLNFEFVWNEKAKILIHKVTAA